MLLSRANLAAIGVASRDKTDGGVYQLRVEKDGTTVASDGNAIMAVEPLVVSERSRPTGFPPVEETGEPDAPVEGFGITPEVVETAVKNLPRGGGAVGAKLGHAAITKCGDGVVELSSTDLQQWKRVEGRTSRRLFPEWRKVFRDLYRRIRGLRQEVEGSAIGRMVVDRKALVRLLKAMDVACPSPDNVVFIEFGGQDDGLLLRAVSVETGQRAIGYVKPLVIGEGEWLRMSRWERGVMSRKKKRRKKK